MPVPGSYEWAREMHASGKNVTCGRGVRPAYAAWNEYLDLPAERVSLEWRIIDWKEVVAKPTPREGWKPAERTARGYYKFLP